MTSQARTGIGHYVRQNLWVIAVDIAGAILLLSLLMTAAGAPALKQWMFVVLTAVPVIAAINLWTPRRQPAPPAAIAPPRPAHQRKIHISPRPDAQRAR